MGDLVDSSEQDILTRAEALRTVPIAVSLRSWRVPSPLWPPVDHDLAGKMDRGLLTNVHPAQPVLERATFE